jgi:large subunit ribosomal protein L13
MSTHFVKTGEVLRDWYLVDADGKTLGRLATEVARVLMGKHKPTYTPNADAGGFVVVVNAEKIRLTGNKWLGKIYFHHSQYPGGLTALPAREMMSRKPRFLVEHAVRGMLPKNRIGDRLIRKMKVYTGENHPHKAQQPGPFPVKLD